MRQSRASTRVLAIGTVLALAAVACGSSTKSSGAPASSTGASGGGNTASAPGVTATSITVGGTTPLTGPAAPGYSEIDPAAAAYFAYVNAHGGVDGRKINFIYKDDGYNPANTTSVTQQLVLQQHIFAELLGLGTPTHSAVVGFLNTEKVPDIFVASGCACWNEPQQHPYTYGWQLDYVRSGKILGAYIKAHYPGQSVAIFYQNDDFGQGGVTGISAELPASQIVTKQPYTAGNINIAPAVSAIAASKAKIVVLYTIPAYTALFRLFTLKVGYNPQLVTVDVGSDPLTLESLLENFAKQGGATVNGRQLIQGMVTDAYLPATGQTANPFISLFKRIHDQYDAKAPFDGNVEYGEAAAYTFVAALEKAGKNLTRQGLLSALNSGALNAPGNNVGLSPFAYSPTDHFGFTGAQIGVIQGDSIVPSGPVFTTTPDPSSPVTSGPVPVASPPASGIPAGS